MKAVPASRSALLLALLLAACATPSPSTAPSAASGPPSRSAAPEPTTTPSGSAVSSGEPIAADPPPLALEEVATGLDAPISITVSPDGWLLVNERMGRVIAVDPESGSTEVALDISDRVIGQGEQGLLGLALHPNWPDDPRAYVHYSSLEGDGGTVLSEFRVTDDPLPPRLDPTTERVLLTVDQPYANHNGGQLAFGPDGFLYMGLGDGGSGGDPHGNGQNPDVLLGKILRHRRRRRMAGTQSLPKIPSPTAVARRKRSSSAFATRGASASIATRGCSGSATSGSTLVEEIDRVDPVADAGANLGWNVMEGSQCFSEENCSADGLTLPVAEYGHDLGCSVTGGYVYRGEAIPDLRGWYLFSDFCTGTLFGIPSDAEGVIGPRTLFDPGFSVSTFGEDPDGELYVADLGGGTIYRIVAGD